MMSSTYEDSKNFEWIFMSVAAVCAVVASAAALLIIRRHSRYKNKFEGLIGSSAEVSKDYQVNILSRFNDIYSYSKWLFIPTYICLYFFLPRNYAEHECQIRKKNRMPRPRE